MKKTVKKTPAYLTLYEQLKKEIVSGAYSYKSKLPSKRSAAERFGVSLVTIEHTYALLEDEGYIQGRQRCGYFVRYRKEQFFPSVPPRMPEKTQPEEFSSSLSLHSKYAGEPSTDQTPVPPLETDCFPPSVYAKAVRRVLSVYGDRILLKTENAGLPLLREAIARYLLRTRTISVLPDQIVIGSGAEQLYNLATILLGKDRLYAIEKPSYEKIRQIYKAQGLRFEELPLGNEGIPDEVLFKSHAEILHVTPYRSYPSGVTASAEKKQTYLSFARSRNAFILEDDFGSEFHRMRPIETLFSLDAAEKGGRVIYLNTFSKTLSPAVRIGYMLIPPSLLPMAEKRIGFFSSSVPVLDQYALAELLNEGSFERHLSRIRRKLNP